MKQIQQIFLEGEGPTLNMGRYIHGDFRICISVPLKKFRCFRFFIITELKKISNIFFLRDFQIMVF